MQNLTLSQPKTPEAIVTKFKQRDCVGDLYQQNKFGLNPPRGFCSSYRWNICPSRVRMFTFFGFSAGLQESPLDRFLRSIRQMTRFSARKCHFIITTKIVFFTYLFEKFQKITMAPMGKIKKFFKLS